MVTETANAVLLATFPACLVLRLGTLVPYNGSVPCLLVAIVTGIGVPLVIHRIISAQVGIAAAAAIVGGMLYGALTAHWFPIDRMAPGLALGIVDQM